MGVTSQTVGVPLSASGEIPAPGTGSGAGTETGSAGSASGGESGTSSGYLEQVGAGGDFAKAEVRKHQSRADTLQAEKQKIVSRLGGEEGSLMKLLDLPGMSAETVALAVTNYAALRNDPKLQPALLEFERTGQLPPGLVARGSNGAETPGSEDEWFDENDPMARELQTVKAELAQAKSSLSGLALNSGKQALQGHLEKFRQEFRLTEEEYGKARDVLATQTRTMNEAAIDRLQSPDGYDTVEALAFSAVKKAYPNFLDEYPTRKRFRRRQAVGDLETDGPSGASTTGEELEPLDLKRASALDVLLHNRAKARRED